MTKHKHARIRQAISDKKLFYFTLHAKNGECLAVSEMLKPQRTSILRTLKNNFPDFVIKDETRMYETGKHSNIIISNDGEECGS